jgi:hypothetical protein
MDLQDLLNDADDINDDVLHPTPVSGPARRRESTTGSGHGQLGFTDSGRTSDCYRDQLRTILQALRAQIKFTGFGEFSYGYGIQLFLLCVCFELYADLPIALTIVHCNGTSILSLHNG